jgi:hypothetical protein
VADEFAARYAGLLAGSYDCVDRIVLNAYYPMGSTAGGFRTWWRRLIGGSDAEADAVLDNAHLMRLAGRFAAGPGPMPRGLGRSCARRRPFAVTVGDDCWSGGCFPGFW